MRLLIQRVRRASVGIDGREHSRIGRGLLALVGIEEADGQEDIDWLAGKLLRLRVFDDERGVMNLDVGQIGGEVMIVSSRSSHPRARVTARRISAPRPRLCRVRFTNGSSPRWRARRAARSPRESSAPT